MKYASAGEGKEQRCFHNGKEGNKKRGRIAGGKCRKAVLRAACAPPIAGEKTSRNKTTAVRRRLFYFGTFAYCPGSAGKTVNEIGGVCKKAKNLPYGAQGQIGLYFSVQNAQAFYSKCRDFRKKTKKLEKTLKRHESCVTINMCSNIAFFGRIGAGSVRRFMV